MNDFFFAFVHLGVGVGSTFNSFLPAQMRPNTGGILPMNYYSYGSYMNNGLTNPNVQQLPQQTSNVNAGNVNAWQKINPNNNYNKPYNRYVPGSQGWYATGGNHWNKNEKSTIACPCLLLISILILIFCKE